jgi:hypothetical protein
MSAGLDDAVTDDLLTRQPGLQNFGANRTRRASLEPSGFRTLGNPNRRWKFVRFSQSMGWTLPSHHIPCIHCCARGWCQPDCTECCKVTTAACAGRPFRDRPGAVVGTRLAWVTFLWYVAKRQHKGCLCGLLLRCCC